MTDTAASRVVWEHYSGLTPPPANSFYPFSLNHKDAYLEIDDRIRVRHVCAPIREDEAAIAAGIAERAAFAPRYQFGIHTDEDGKRRIVVRSAHPTDMILIQTRDSRNATDRDWGASWRRAEADPTVRYFTSERLGLSDIAVQTFLETRMLVAYIPTWWCGSRRLPAPHTIENRMYQYFQILAPRFAILEAQMFAAIDAADPHRRRRHILAARPRHLRL